MLAVSVVGMLFLLWATGAAAQPSTSAAISASAPAASSSAFVGPIGGGGHGGAHADEVGGEGGGAPSDVPPPAIESSSPVEPDPPTDIITLPPIEVREAPNPVVMDDHTPELVLPRGSRTWLFVRTLLGVVVLLLLAWAGGHPRVRAIEEKLGVTQVMTAGFPFVALGVIARLPVVGILSDSVLVTLAPVLRIALGWLGFLIGFRFDARAAIDAPPRTTAFVAWRGIVTLAIVSVASVIAMVIWRTNDEASVFDPVVLRDALILGVAGTLTSLSAVRLLHDRGGAPRSVAVVEQALRREEIIGICGLLVIAAYFRPSASEVSWQLPGTAWMLLTLGTGLAMGLLSLAIVTRRTKTRSELLVIVLGTVAFSAGLASNLRLSPVVVCFVAGLIVGNTPGTDKAALGRILSTIERPIYLLFLVVVGALWDASDGLGWLLMAIFVVARLSGKWLGTATGVRTQEYALEPDSRRALIVAPMGALSIAIVVNAELLYPGGAPWNITAIVGGAIVTEVIVQLAHSRRSRSVPPAAPLPPVDAT